MSPGAVELSNLQSSSEFSSEPTMPHDLRAEASVLGSMMLSGNACVEALSILTAADFYTPIHEHLFAIMESLFSAGQPVDSITVLASASRQGLTKQLDNGTYISHLIAAPASTSNVGYYADIVKGKSVLRSVAEASLRGFHEAIASAADPIETSSKILNDVVNAATRHIPEGSQTAGQVMEEAIAWVEKRNSPGHIPLSTGYPDLDSYLTEISDGQLILVAARPSTGKSVALLDIARHTALKSRRPCLFFSLEMSAWEIGLRLIAAETGIAINSIKNGQLDDVQWQKIADALSRISAAPLHIETNPHLTVADIRARAVRHKRKEGLDLIFIDYLGLITPSGQRRDHYVEIGEIARGLKILSKDVAPVIAAAQLNRNSENRPDKRPALADLRSSGSLEQDSDIVLLLHREDMYDNQTPRIGEVDLIIAKNRNGPTGSIILSAQLDKARFASLYSGL